MFRIFKQQNTKNLAYDLLRSHSYERKDGALEYTSYSSGGHQSTLWRDSVTKYGVIFKLQDNLSKKIQDFELTDEEEDIIGFLSRNLTRVPTCKKLTDSSVVKLIHELYFESANVFYVVHRFMDLYIFCDETDNCIGVLRNLLMPDGSLYDLRFVSKTAHLEINGQGSSEVDGGLESLIDMLKISSILAKNLPEAEVKVV